MGKWKVMSQQLAGRKMYIVGRQLDESKPLHGGNVEYCGSYTDDREACEALAASLNKQEVGE